MRFDASHVYDLAADLLLEASAAEPSAIVEHHVGEAEQLFGSILDQVLRIIEHVPKTAWASLIAGLLYHVDPRPLRDSLVELRLRGLALGADDSRIEVDQPEGDIDAPDAFARSSTSLLLKAPAPVIRGNVTIGTHLDPVRPWLEVLGEFLERGSITREAWDVLEARERREVFTIAYQSTTSFVAKIHEVVSRGLADGVSVRDMVEKVRSAGEEITRWHAETVYRNAVQSAYSRGRAAHMTQPHVVAARPWWQYRAVNDVRTRKTHRRVSGWVMRADDPGWQTTFPPCGHNCRCRVVARSESWVERSGATIHTGPLPGLPDQGWTTTPPPVVRFAA